MAKMDSLENLFIVLLSDIYFVELKTAESLPALVRKAQSKDLKDALQTHLKETKEQITRLETIFKNLNEKPVRVEWINNMNSLFEKGQKFFEDNSASPVVDATIIALAQRLEHYEIATYGTLKELASVLEYDEIEKIINETLKEEGHADSLLTKLAKGGIFSKGINVKAVGR